MTKAREELIKELKLIIINEYNPDLNINCPNYEKLANFIIADRARIVEPLVKYKDDCKEIWSWTIPREETDKAIDETLKLAGVENDTNE